MSLLKFYVVNAVQSGRSDKVSEFFEKMASELQHQSEWKEWFGKKDCKSDDLVKIPIPVAFKGGQSGKAKIES